MSFAGYLAIAFSGDSNCCGGTDVSGTACRAEADLGRDVPATAWGAEIDDCISSDNMVRRSRSSQHH